MPIKVTCPGCSGSFNAPDAAAGKKAKCPKCGGPIEIPLPPPVDDIFDVEEVPQRAFDDDDFAVEPPTPLPDEGRKSCPMCGEMIAREAVKCRFCGEIFDPVLKKRSKKKRKSGGSYYADDDLTGGDWALAIICSSIGCIMGIIYLIQGKPKGGKMIGVSLGMIVIWNVIAAVIRGLAGV